MGDVQERRGLRGDVQKRRGLRGAMGLLKPCARGRQTQARQDLRCCVRQGKQAPIARRLLIGGYGVAIESAAQAAVLANLTARRTSQFR